MFGFLKSSHGVSVWPILLVVGIVFAGLCIAVVGFERHIETGSLRVVKFGVGLLGVAVLVAIVTAFL